jgi:putative SOS response-associated peptidase YedK
MCGRFTRIIPLEDIVQAFAIAENARDLGPSYNIAPTQPIAVIQEESGGRRLVPLRWGLIPAWAKGSVSSHATFIFSGTACTLAPLKGGRAHDMPAL